MYRVLFTLTFFLFSCSDLPEDPEPPVEVSYGDRMFDLQCTWPSLNFEEGTATSDSVFYCWAEDVSSDIIDATYVSLALQIPEHLDERIRICGENLYLYSGHSLYDNLLPSLTNQTYACVNAYDQIKNNEFDWYWHEEERMLEFNWRPEQNPPVDMFLVIDEPAYGLPAYINGYSSKGVIYLKKGF